MSFSSSAPAADSTPIVAVATAPGSGAIGIVRISGGDINGIAAGVLGRDLPPPAVAVRARFYDADKRVIDDGLALYFQAPKSATGQHLLELHAHGGEAVLAALCARCERLGARRAAAGEFSQRAYLNGKLDLAQAEAVNLLIRAQTETAARAARRALQGDFSRAARAIARQVIDARVFAEGAIDFADEEIDLPPDWESRIPAIAADLDSLVAQTQSARRFAEGVSLAIVGAPNVGKSSIFNRLLGQDAAIVSPLPGATRDALRESFAIDGLPIRLVDTAGWRLDPDEIEALGIARARRETETADVVLLVFEAGGEPPPRALARQIEAAQTGAKTLKVANKIDLNPRAKIDDDAVAVSAKTGAGWARFLRAIREAAGETAAEPPFLAAARHLAALEAARAHLQNASCAATFDILAEELRLVAAALGQITGETASEELLGEIFARFCVGK